MKTASTLHHDDVWLLLPWLVNGRLSGAQRAQVEEHLQECAACAQETATQRRMVALLTAPERVTYAPGPSLRKLMERIDAHGSTPERETRPAPPLRPRRHAFAATWRPPGLAWAATFVLTVTLGLITATSYRWSQPRYSTYTATRPSAEVLHIAFDRALPVGDVEEVLRAAGARVVEGPGTSGIFGVVPVAPLTRSHGADPVSPELRTLAARLQADSRVRWIEPLAVTGAPEAPAGKR